MQRARTFVALVGVVLGLVSVQALAKETPPKVVAFRITGEQIEGCECRAVCGCVFKNEATFDQCRVVLTWRITEGKHGDVDLAGCCFAMSITKSGKDIEKSMGTWEGIGFLPEKATEAQRKALADILARQFGPAYAKMETRTVPIDVKAEGDDRVVTIGDVARVQLVPIRDKAGRLCTIENAPSPVALPKFVCARAVVHTYDDGKNKWDFSNHNGFYGAFEFKGEESSSSRR